MASPHSGPLIQPPENILKRISEHLNELPEEAKIAFDIDQVC